MTRLYSRLQDLDVVTRFYSRLQGSLQGSTSWFSKVITHYGYHCPVLSKAANLLLSFRYKNNHQYKTNITARRYRQLLVCRARALRPGVTPSRGSFGRALLRVYKSICLAICEVVSKSAGSFPASRHQVVPLGTGGKSLGQVECDACHSPRLAP